MTDHSLDLDNCRATILEIKCDAPKVQKARDAAVRALLKLQGELLLEAAKAPKTEC